MALLSLYLVLMAILSLHGAHRVFLTWIYLRHHREEPLGQPWEDLPIVTVQLPVYNERDVVARLVRATTALHWPKDRLRIQLLDDATDDTLAQALPAIQAAQATGLQIQVLHRDIRTGYKAGALEAGMQQDDAEFIAIFDADFIPRPDFLERVMPYLKAPEVGMVQTRWGHLNEGHNALTQAQALLLDGHFVIEHTARSRLGAWTHFNGTGGIWRRRCIEDGGGWQHDTLTEDLDLSYRAQMAGWRFIYLLNEVVPAELPEHISGLRSQQARWARGSVQTFRKLIARILRGPYSLLHKIEAWAHLSANFSWPLCLCLALLLPLAGSLPHQEGLSWWLLNAPSFLLSTGANVLFYGAARPRPAEWHKIPLVLALGLGLSLNQSMAVWEGLRPGGEFLRTPKRGDGIGSYRAVMARSGVSELLIGFWNLYGSMTAIRAGHFGIVPFLLLFASGFFWVGGQSLWERRER